MAILLSVVLGVSAWATWVSFSRRTMSQATDQISASLKDVGRSLKVRGTADYGAWALGYLSITALPTGEHILLAVPGGERYGSQGSNGLLRAPAVAKLLARPPAQSQTTTVSTPSGRVLVLASPMREQGRTVGSVVVTYALESLEQDQERVLVLVSIEAVIALLGPISCSGACSGRSGTSPRRPAPSLRAISTCASATRDRTTRWGSWPAPST